MSAKSPPLNKSGWPVAPGERVSKAVADVQPRRVSPFAKAAKGFHRQLGLISVHRHVFDTSAADKSRQIGYSVLAFFTEYDERRLHETDHGNQLGLGAVDGIDKANALGFIK